MSDDEDLGRCNRCGEPLAPDAPVTRAFSGRWPYQHERREDCPALRGASADGEGVADVPEE